MALKQNVVKPLVVETLMNGPQPGCGIRFCLHCWREFKPGETWRMISRLGRGGYSVGVHDSCLADMWGMGAQVSTGQGSVAAAAGGVTGRWMQ